MEQRALVGLAIEVLRSATNVSHVAARAVQILERMLEREADRRSSVPLAPAAEPRELSTISEDVNIFDGSTPLDWTSILNAMSSATTKGALAPDGTDANSAFWHGIANTDLDDLFVAGEMGVDGGQSWTLAL